MGIYHARNLDYGLPGLQNFTADITFLRNGSFVSRGTMYVGYLGVLTGQHLEGGGNAAWSISLNQRFLSIDSVPYLPTVKAFLHGVQNVGFTLRDALEEQVSFRKAKLFMQRAKFPAPAFLTMAGVKRNEGIVITRNRNGTAVVPFRSSWRLAVRRGRWFHLETNFDNWWPDRLTDGRRQAARKHLKTLGRQHADLDGLFEVLSTPPVLANGTIYTTVMMNEAGFLQTTVREHDDATMQSLQAERLPKTAAGLKELYDWYVKQP